jgi:hypothetical protein
MEFGEIVFGQFRFFVLGVRKRARLLGINLNTREKQIPHPQEPRVRDDKRAWAGAGADGLGGARRVGRGVPGSLFTKLVGRNIAKENVT